ncbi:MAG: hypothetical protein HYX34_12510 [Actinobacteria bacterium]|nr:hypothetical protein [Actinomycetota bacterium]
MVTNVRIQPSLVPQSRFAVEVVESTVAGLVDVAVDPFDREPVGGEGPL